MGELVKLPPRDIWANAGSIQLIKRGPFKACNNQEFDEAVAVAKSLGLNPLRKEIYAFVFSADKPDKRNMVLVTGIMGYRSIAQRHGNYLPGPTSILYDEGVKNERTNPRGIVSASATVRQFSHGGWHDITEEVTWESYAPIISQKWDYDRKSMVAIDPQLDSKRDAWIRMPDVMLKKCAEAQALRRGWPSDFSRLYVEEELHRGQILDAEYSVGSPSEIVEKQERAARLAAIGGEVITVDPMKEGEGLIGVPHGRAADWFISRATDLAAKHGGAAVATFRDRNRQGLRELWAFNSSDTLAVKKELERLEKEGAPKPTTEDQPADEATLQDADQW